MPSRKNRLALLFGGAGCEHSVSCTSAAAFLSHIDRAANAVYPVGITREGGWYFYTGDEAHIADGSWSADAAHLTPTFPVRIGRESGFRRRGRLLHVDAAIPVLHGDFGEDGVVQGVLKAAGIPFVGCDVTAGALCADKALTKRLAASLGIPVVPYEVAEDGDAEAVLSAVRRRLCFPLFVKPALLGSSVGAAVARTPEEFLPAYRDAARHGKVLIESYLSPIRECEIAFLDGDLPVLSAPGEIVSAAGFYDFSEKYQSATASVSTCASLPDAVRERMTSDSLRLIRLLGVRDLCRADWFYTADGRLYFNEINTFPGFTDASLYPRLIAGMGISYDALVARLIERAVHRSV